MPEKFDVDQMKLMYQLFQTGIGRGSLVNLYDAVVELYRLTISTVNENALPSTQPSQSIEKYNGYSEDDCSQQNDAASQGYVEDDLWSSQQQLASLTPPPSTSSIDNDPSLEAFKKMGEDQILKEIRTFVEVCQIRQSKIADDTHQPVNYISRFLDGGRVSAEIKNSIYRWYLRAKKDSTLSPSPSFSSPSSQESQVSNCNTAKDKDKKRDRFIFRTCHYEILNEAYELNHYPENDLKEELVEKCNAALAAQKKRSLLENETMRMVHINNWFNNRRKKETQQKRSKNQSAPAKKTCQAIEAAQHQIYCTTSYYEDPPVAIHQNHVENLQNYAQEDDSNSDPSNNLCIRENYSISLADIKIEPENDEF